MKKVIIGSLALLLAIVFSGCATWSTSSVKLNDKSGSEIVSKDEKKSAEQIILSKSDILDKKYKILADIEVTVNKTTIFNADPTPEMVNKELREKAAELGADAVVFVRYGEVGMSFMSYGALNGKGRAIAFIN